MLPSAERASAVFAGSLKYSNGVAVLNQTVPGVPVGQGCMFSSRMCRSPSSTLADRAAMRQPLRAVAGGEAEAFGGAVIFVDDRSPPFDHVLLHRAGQGAAAWIAISSDDRS